MPAVVNPAWSLPTSGCIIAPAIAQKLLPRVELGMGWWWYKHWLIALGILSGSLTAGGSPFDTTVLVRLCGVLWAV